VALLRASVHEMAADLGEGVVVVELGAGSAAKTPILIAALDRPALYAPIDIAASYLLESEAQMARTFPGLPVSPVEADFTRAWRLPEAVAALPGRRLGFFPGSTIGNLDPEAGVALLARAHEALGEGAAFLLGADLAKDPAILIPAYDDALGVTAAFNKNLLVRINRELRGGFDLSAFAHEARWNAAASRIEMHLVSLKDQRVPVLDFEAVFARGETIHTESSHKYTLAMLEQMIAAAGWRVDRTWLAPGDAYAMFRLRA
jgi:dimethylhistidine N-methyltransferase